MLDFPYVSCKENIEQAVVLLDDYLSEYELSVYYFWSSRIFETLTMAHSDDSFGQLLLQPAKSDVLIIDYWGWMCKTRNNSTTFLK